ncbi:hypothetical protein PIOMA14_II_0549 [Prevotella intermedia]|uniref:Uncharacterized protein n=1 Tax=Prevotella intermedia TaxID=28131 RepID=A0A0T7APM7_PREIN|nr:hypothetical protein PIOMA14_II_0549 [Prevotella intermedia]
MSRCFCPVKTVEMVRETVECFSHALLSAQVSSVWSVPSTDNTSLHSF